MAANRDTIIIGAGLMGLAIARQLHAGGMQPLVLERARAGSAASWAGAGMLAARQMDPASPLRPLALASAEDYPEFVRELEREVGTSVDYRPCGSLVVGSGEGDALAGAALRAAEPALADEITSAALVADHCVDNRRLVAALAEAVRLRGIPLIEHCAVRGATAAGGGGWEVATEGGPRFQAAHLIIAAGAWSGGLAVAGVRPRKGQMLALAAPAGLLRHVIVAPGVYLVPREDGRIVVGATVEEAGFDTTVEPAAIARLRTAAIAVAPALAGCEAIETWAGLRPGSHDDLPYLGAIPGAPGLWAATGHFRDGILLTPITARVIADLVTGREPRLDLAAFAPARYQPPL
ncbi:MAG: NAD(P)/FAD-dependent oxidoreductase [Terriglobales bacterium]